MRTQLAQIAMYGGALTAVAAALADLETAKTWAEVLTPAHVFGSAGALVTALGALFHPVPGQS